MLPAALAIPESDTPTSACLLAFGEHQDAKAFFGGVPITWGARYHELMLAIPCVGGEANPYLFVPAMACDAWWAVWNGNVHYGFGKRLVSIQWDGSRYRVEDESHERDSFDATLHRKTGGSIKPLTWIRSAASLPVLGRRADGRFIESRFDWDFAEASIEPIAVHVNPGRDFGVHPLARLFSDEAFFVRQMRWRLSWPTTSSVTAGPGG